MHIYHTCMTLYENFTGGTKENGTYLHDKMTLLSAYTPIYAPYTISFLVIVILIPFDNWWGR